MIHRINFSIEIIHPEAILYRIPAYVMNRIHKGRIHSALPQEIMLRVTEI